MANAPLPGGSLSEYDPHVSEVSELRNLSALLASHRFREAEELVASLTDTTAAVRGWLVVARTHAVCQRWDDARRAIEAALHLQPASRLLKIERAAIITQQGFAQAALSELEQLVREGEDSPQLVLHLAQALIVLGRSSEAETQLELGLQRWPLDEALHRSVIRLRWLSGCGESSTARLERTIVAYPRELQLRLLAADALRNAGFLERALETLQGGLQLAPQSVGFLTSIGVVLDGLDRPGDALPYLRAAAERGRRGGPAKRNLIPTLLRLSEPIEALAICDELLADSPDDQLLIAYRATALRMLGDARYESLHDYDRLVRIYRPDPPSAFTRVSDFNEAFAAAVLAFHTTDRRPLDQSLRGGTQTDRNLPLEQPAVAAFMKMIDAPIRDYISRLRDGSDHPTDRRRAAGYRIAGSWSVRLSPQGFHTNHVHPKGWLSSAYYIDLPEGMGTDESRAGWLKFGEPGQPTPGCSPNHFVRPEPGMLVLFPSYMWHGTVPFTEGGHRLTAAFDVVPT